MRIGIDLHSKERIIDHYNAEGDFGPAKYIRITAKNRGRVPDWHLGANGKAWIFADEFVIR